MIYRFLIISDEVDNFMREIQLDANATFLDFHRLIIKACGYEDNQLTSFTICERGWEKGDEITLEEMDSYTGRGNRIMADTELSEYLEDEKQHLLYTFDTLADRVFFIELAQIVHGKNLKEGTISRSIGDAPQQVLDFDEMLNRNPVSASDSSLGLDDELYGSEVDTSEIDLEGFDISDDF